MGKSSRWSQWVISESTDPSIPMPWTLVDRARNAANKSVPAGILTKALTPVAYPLR